MRKMVTINDLPKMSKPDGALGTVKVTRHIVTCVCGQQVLGVFYDGVMRGWCAVSRQMVTIRE